MNSKLSILIEKFLRQQVNAEETDRLKKLFTQTDTEDLLSNWYEEKWEQAVSDPEKEVENRIWSKLQKQIHAEPSTSKSGFPIWKKGLRIAASILIPLCCAGLGYYLSENKPGQNNDRITVQVETGQKANIQLSDGTQVQLNSASSLTYDNTYNKKNRTVYLQGEACFEVNKNEEHPFIVKANDISVEALGTHFDVKAYPDDNYVAATLIEGRIRVNSPLQSEILEPNEKLVFTKNSGQFAKSVLPDAAQSIFWINNQLAFEQERLEDMARVLERMYNIHVRFASDELKSIRFSGVIKNNSLESVLQMISFVSPVRFAAEGDTAVIIYGK
ncbi:MAG: FecR domain-containing protein [Dysgonamonadaceae bacterium]|jgi:ferric-dicitrate binding protein FerR (iron transport regulator)|nr:FecR domain-containing protein [Dysgonamonadaceae bacterium]